jgi:hypothetical protein
MRLIPTRTCDTRPLRGHMSFATSVNKVVLTRCVQHLPLYPLRWEVLLNGGSRATPGLGKPLNEPDRDHDERMLSPRFSRVP